MKNLIVIMVVIKSHSVNFKNGKYKLEKIDEAVGYSYNENNEEQDQAMDQQPDGENEEQELENEELDEPTKKNGRRLSLFDPRNRKKKDDAA